jgi:transposase InsO family protein
MGRKRSEAGGRAEAGSGPAGGLRAKRQFTPEERRKAVEAYRASGLTQKVFARQWGVSHMTLWGWARKYAQAGPQGLERLAEGAPKRRGKAPLAEAVKAEIVATRRRFPAFGLKKIRDWLGRFGGLKVSRSSVKRVVDAAGLARAAAPPKRRRKAAPPRRFERARPGLLWQTDITYLHVGWQRGPLYLIVFLDDCSRYVVGHGLYTHQRHEIALETFQEACARFGRPKEVLSDQGRQYFAWRGKSEFEKLLEREGVKHVVARAQHPETVGKCERFWETLKKELWDRVHPKDLEEARARVTQFIAHHNHFRPHQSLEGMVPADRFFGVESEVRKAIEATMEKNALRLALGEAPRKPVFLVGQIDGEAVSLHGESGRIVVSTPDGRVREIQTKDLGAAPPTKEASDERKDEGRDDDGEPGGAPAGGSGGQPRGAGGAGAEEGAHGPEADGVPGAGDAAGRADAVGGGERGAAAAGAPDGGGGAQDVAGEAQA